MWCLTPLSDVLQNIMSTSKRRTPITVQAVTGLDDDLIYWLRCIPKGDKQQRLKAALRIGIEAERARQTALDSVGTILARLDEIAADDIVAAVNASLAELLDIMRHDVQNEAKATRDLIGMAALTPSAKTSTTPITAAPQLDQDEVERRKASMKAKAQW